MKGDRHRDRREFGDVTGGKLSASDEDEDRHRSSRGGARQAHKSSTAAQQGDVFTACECSSLMQYLFCSDTLSVWMAT